MIVERDCNIPAANALPRIADWFRANGYDLVAKSAGEMSLFHKAVPSHPLSIRSDGRRVTFEFGIDGDEYQRRVDASMTTLTGVPSASAPKRCPTCSTMAAPGATECAVCGTALT